MREILVIGLNGFRESLRDRILYNLVFFALLLIGLSVLLADLTIMEHHRLIKDVGLAAINMVGVVIAIFVGIGLVSLEIERRTVYTVLSRPISRAQFVLGKYVGIALTLLVNISVMLAMFLGALWLYHVPIQVPLFQAVALMYVELLLLAAIAVLFSTFSSSTLSATLTIVLFVIGHLTTDLQSLVAKGHGETSRTIMNVIYYLCPNFEVLNMKGSAAQGAEIQWAYQGWATLYGLLYAATLIVGACLIFRRRDF